MLCDILSVLGGVAFALGMLFLVLFIIHRIVTHLEAQDSRSSPEWWEDIRNQERSRLKKEADARRAKEALTRAQQIEAARVKSLRDALRAQLDKDREKLKALFPVGGSFKHLGLTLWTTSHDSGRISDRSSHSPFTLIDPYICAPIQMFAQYANPAGDIRYFHFTLADVPLLQAQNPTTEEPS